MSKDWYIIKGDDINVPVTIRHSDGTPYDLTDATVCLTVKLEDDLLEDNTLAVIAERFTTHTDPLSGQTLILVSHGLTSTLDHTQKYKYDIQIVKDSFVFSIPSGRFIVRNDVTKGV